MTGWGGRTRWLALLASVVLVAAVVATVVLLRARDEPALPRAEADSFLKAWSRGDMTALQRLTGARPAELGTAATSLTASSPSSRLRVRRTALVRHVEQALIRLGCLKVNLQVLASNAAVVAFYEKLGYRVEDRVSMGKVL